MMIDHIKEIVKNYLNNKEMADLEIGVIVSKSPLKIKIPNLIEPIDTAFIIVPIRLNNSFEINDKVAMLKAMGGQKYYLLDKVV